MNTYFDNLPPNDLVGVHVARSLCMIEQEKQDSIFSHNQSVQFETTKPGDEMVGDEVTAIPRRTLINRRVKLAENLSKYSLFASRIF